MYTHILNCNSEVDTATSVDVEATANLHAEDGSLITAGHALSSLASGLAELEFHFTAHSLFRAGKPGPFTLQLLSIWGTAADGTEVSLLPPTSLPSPRPIPWRTSPRGSSARRPVVDQALADELLGRAEAGGVELLGPDGLLSQVTKVVLERALAEEMTGHLGYDKHDPAGRGSGNSRNGTTPKTVLTDIGAIDLAVPRDRSGSFEPQVVRKGQTRLEGFNERIIALYARGMTTRDIRAHQRQM